MRAYALLLGIALTTGYGYAADVAVASRRPVEPKPAASVGPVWFGGVLEPVTVEIRGGEVRTIRTESGRVIHRSTLQCSETPHEAVSTIS